ncbi:hypothetical protein K788_0000288 [Paraburkholderia caribensis MBA4]|uniref:Uncharacterized protein n=1 Tax=Paraburkholderia caribensis MBA4 TaxID=1323664 RepID=A0A0P0RIU4_9BURK|nr:hypothetical protein K788_0000288 [Paraburkholderia caribensis MBA4]
MGASEAQGFATKPLASLRSFGESMSNEMSTTAKTALGGVYRRKRNAHAHRVRN